MRPDDPRDKAAAETNGLRMPEQLTLDAITAEVTRARLKFPNPNYLMTALMEEVGELAKAMMDHYVFHKPGADKDQIEREAIQVAAMAIRLLEEGDPTFRREGKFRDGFRKPKSPKAPIPGAHLERCEECSEPIDGPAYCDNCFEMKRHEP